MIKQLETQSGSNQIAVQIIQPASIPTAPAPPKPVINLALGALLGLLLGIVGAFFRDALDTSFRSRERLADSTGAPTLGVIPFVRGTRKAPAGCRHGFTDRDGRGIPVTADEPAFQLGVDLGGTPQLDVGGPVSVVVTSSLPDEGTTSTVCNLAIAAADAGRTVLVIDANLRSPAVTDLLKLEHGPGLAEVLAGDAVLVRSYRLGEGRP